MRWSADSVLVARIDDMPVSQKKKPKISVILGSGSKKPLAALD